MAISHSECSVWGEIIASMSDSSLPMQHCQTSHKACGHQRPPTMQPLWYCNACLGMAAYSICSFFILPPPELLTYVLQLFHIPVLGLGPHPPHQNHNLKKWWEREWDEKTSAAHQYSTQYTLINHCTLASRAEQRHLHQSEVVEQWQIKLAYAALSRRAPIAPIKFASSNQEGVGEWLTTMQQLPSFSAKGKCLLWIFFPHLPVRCLNNLCCWYFCHWHRLVRASVCI